MNESNESNTEVRQTHLSLLANEDPPSTKDPTTDAGSDPGRLEGAVLTEDLRLCDSSREKASLMT